MANRAVPATQEPASQPLAATGFLPALFTVTIFLGSALLFLLEPMFAKMVLPVFGGSPAVWNTLMVFFQSALFLAYIYSHYVANTSVASSLWIHSFVLIAPFLVLPVSIHSAASLQTVIYHPAAAVIIIAVVSIGLPFFVVATSSPLLQGWFSQTVHPAAADPYFLYAASNAGSLIGLALYPFVIEPTLRNSRQALVWSLGYGVFVVLTLVCGLATLRHRSRTRVQVDAPSQPRPEGREKLLWAALAFVPASLLYSFTAQLSTDFPPIPLLWVVPLSLYLLTFTMAFSPRLRWQSKLGRLLPSVLIAGMVIFLIGFGVRPGGWAAMGVIKLFCFVVIALGFHGELAHRRPGSQYLTEYYLWISAGGILGGLLNAFVAPVLFSDFWEYPLTLIIAAALLPAFSALPRRRINPKYLAIAIATVSIAGIALQLRPGSSTASKLAVLAVGAILCMRAPVKWTAAALVLISLSVGRIDSSPLYRNRSFFGTYEVTTAAGGKWHILRHGTTIHGLQRVVDSPLTNPPRGYYMPVKAVFDSAFAHQPAVNVAVVGLGAGIIACYSTPEQSTTFYEIDPLVERIANRYFTLLSQCQGHKKVVLGDARLTLRDAASHSYDAIVLDAFSSDSIPVHLLTKEAFNLYGDKLKPGGMLLVHISNNYLELAPVVAGSAAQLGYSTLLLEDTQVTPSEASQGRMASRWALAIPADRTQAFESNDWKPFMGTPVTWTDDRCSIFSVVIWPKLLGVDLLRRR